MTNNCVGSLLTVRTFPWVGSSDGTTYPKIGVGPLSLTRQLVDKIGSHYKQDETGTRITQNRPDASSFRQSAIPKILH